MQWKAQNIQPLNDSLAQLSAAFHEDITDAKDSISHYDGYFTALAHNTLNGWKLRNAHWSINKSH